MKEATQEKQMEKQMELVPVLEAETDFIKSVPPQVMTSC